jgi:hypothetical protein
MSERKPIAINPHCIAVLHLFERKDFLEDMWAFDLIGHHYANIPQEGAQEFVKQLSVSGQETPAFLMALIVELVNHLRQEDLSRGTNFVAEALKRAGSN